MLVAGFSKLSVVCVCVHALGLFGGASKDCRDVTQNSSPGALLSAAFLNKEQGCKGQNAHNSKARAGSACKVFYVFARKLELTENCGNRGHSACKTTGLTKTDLGRTREPAKMTEFFFGARVHYTLAPSNKNTKSPAIVQRKQTGSCFRQ